MAKWKDITGIKFNRLIAIKMTHVDKLGKAWWLCLCECGKEHSVRGISLRAGEIKSCGCLWEPNIKHGESGNKTPTYSSWANMIDRCFNTKNINYKNYGARGITVCDEWRDYRNFLADMGHKPKGLTIERKENNGNYTPDNYKWASTYEQSRNRRNNAMYYFNGSIITASDLAVILKIPRNRLYDARRRNKDESYYGIKRSN